MTKARTNPEIDSALRRAARRRAARGVVASYIHELSGRHRDREHRPARLAAADTARTIQPSEGGLTCT